jgi:AcrR family transcriptional regulator
MAKAIAKLSAKSKILEAALTCFVKTGIGNTRIKDIAVEAGVDQPLIHYYFPTLDSLYKDIIEIVLNHLKEHSIAAFSRNINDPAKMLASYIRAPFSWAEKNQGYFSIWMYFYYLASFNPFFTQVSSVIRETGRDRISVILYRGIESGHFKIQKGQTVKDLAINIQGLITGNTIMAGSEDRKLLPVFASITEKQILQWLEAK